MSEVTLVTDPALERPCSTDSLPVLDEDNEILFAKPSTPSYTLRTKNSKLSMKHPQPRMNIRMADWNPPPSPPERAFLASPLQSGIVSTPSRCKSRSPMPSAYESSGPSPMPSALPTPSRSPAHCDDSISKQSFSAAPLLARAATMISKSAAPKPFLGRNTAYHGAGGDLVSAPVQSGRSIPSTKAKRSGLNMSVSSLTDMFAGSSAPMSFGILPSPSKNPSVDPMSSANGYSSTETIQSRPSVHRRSSTLGAAASFLGLANPSPTRQSRSPRLQQQTLFEDPSDASDPYLDPEFDIGAALFSIPITPDPSRDTTPDTTRALTTLHANAHTLTSSLLASYRAKHASLQNVRARIVSSPSDLSSQSDLVNADELEESRERAKHLKLQLDGMAAKVAEQEQQLKASERRMRGSVRVVDVRRAETVAGSDGNSLPTSSHGEEEESVMEIADSELALRPRPWRRSQLQREHEHTSRFFSASGIYDSEDEGLDSESCGSRAPSVFDRPSSQHSQTGTELSSTASDEDEARQSWRNSVGAPFLPPSHGSGPRLMKENEDLRRRIRELEETVQGCLGLVGEL